MDEALNFEESVLSCTDDCYTPEQCKDYLEKIFYCYYGNTPIGCDYTYEDPVSDDGPACTHNFEDGSSVLAQSQD